MREHRRFALHVLVRFHGVVVEDRVIRKTDGPLRISGSDGVLAIPLSESGEDLGELKWLDRYRLRLASGAMLLPGQVERLVQDDIEVELRLVPQYDHPRQILAGGDWFIVAAMAAMTLVAIFFQQLLGMMVPAGGPPSVEPSAELIARLLDEDYDGADEGVLYEEQARPVTQLTIDSFYLPAGDEGKTDALGGAEEVDERSLEKKVEQDQRHQPLPMSPDAVADAERASEDSPIEGVTAPQQFGQDLLGETQKIDDATEVAADREGWGFRDHDGAMDARRDELEIRTEIAKSKAALKIDPDDPWALSNLAYYQYLGGKYSDARRTHERYVELYPDSAAGYNNLALVFKRTGEFSKEEGYYRLALAISPDDPHAMNNLAVNLAHQDRYDEALELMEQVAVLEPGEPYADLHRAKIHASMGHEETAFDYLEKALSGMAALDTLHMIEFRQDIRVDPSFDALRQEPRFAEILTRFYGPETGMTLVGGHG